MSVASALALLLLVGSGCIKKKSGPSSGELAGEAITSSAASGIATPTITSPASSPYYFNGSSVTVSGACTSGLTVVLSGADGQQVTCSSGSYSFSVSKSTDATYQFSVLQKNSNEVESASATATWVRDSTVPAAPTLTTPEFNPITTGDTDLIIAGTCEASSTVTIAGNVVAGDMIVPSGALSTSCSSGTFTFTVRKSSDATYNFTFTVTDQASNVSSQSSLAWTRDTNIPPTPTITTPSSSPYYSSASSLVIAGGCRNGHTVTLSGASSQTYTCASNAYTFTVNKSSDATFNFRVKQTTASINSAQASQVWIRDTITPPAPTKTRPLSNPYISGDNSVTFNGSCENGTTISMSGAQSGSTSCSQGIFSFALSQSTNATYSYSFLQTDSASNASPSLSFTWVHDSTTQARPTITAPTNAVHYSNGGNVVVSGACTTGLTVTLAGDVVAGDVTSPASSLTQTCSSSAYSFTVAKSTDSTYKLGVKQTSAAGVDSAQSVVQWVRDTSAPSAPTVTNPPTGTYTSQGPNLVISGACSENATVNLTGDDTQNVVCTSSAYSFTVTESSDAAYAYTIKQTDQAGNQSTGATVNWTRTSSLPSNPTVIHPGSNPYYSAESTLSLNGGCTTGSTVTLGGDVVAGDVTSPAGSLTQTCASSVYSFTISKTDSTYNFTVKQTVSAVDSGTVGQTWVRDTAAPNTTISSQPADPGLRSNPTFTFTSTESNSTFLCRIDGGSYTSCSSPKTYTGLSNGGPHTFDVKAKDRAGNEDSTAASYSWNQEYFDTIALFHYDSGAELTDSGSFTGSNDNGLTNNGTGGVTFPSATAKFSQAGDWEAGDSDYLSKSNNNSQGTLDSFLTAETFAKFESLPGNGASMTLISKSGGAGQLGWDLNVTRSGSLYYLVFKTSLDGSTQTTFTTPSDLALDTTSYHHYAATFSEGRISIYYDGTRVLSKILGLHGSSTQWISTAALQIGKNNSSSTLFDGIIDETRLSQTVRWYSSFTPTTSAYSAD